MFKALLLQVITLLSLTTYKITDNLAFKLNSKIAGYSIVTDSKDSNNNLIISYFSDNTRKYFRYNNTGAVLYESVMKDNYIETIGNSMFFSGSELYSVDVNNPGKVTYYNIKDKSCKDVEIYNDHNKKTLIACNFGNIYVCDMNSSRVKYIKKEIFNEKDVAFKHVKYFDGNLAFAYKKNGIAVYSMDKNRLLWKYDTGNLPVKVLGIKFGSLPNAVSDLEIDEKRNLLIVNCGLGSIYEFDVPTGRIIRQVENFRGTGSNAGVMNYIDLKDMNNDGVDDIIGGSVDHNIYCINGKDLSLIWRYDTDNEIQLPLSFCDINKDGIPEVFSLNDYDNTINVLDGKTGKQIIQKNVKDKNYNKLNQSSVILADYNGNGQLDLIVRVNPQKLQLYEMSDVKVTPNRVVYLPRF